MALQQLIDARAAAFDLIESAKESDDHATEPSFVESIKQRVKDIDSMIYLLYPQEFV